jgi:hypothetical protein
VRFVVLDQSFMRGANAWLEGLDEPNRMIKFAQDAALMFDPFVGAQRTMVEALDPTARSPRGFVEAFQSVTPGLSTTVPPLLDPFGEPVARRGRFFENFVSPFRPQPDIVTDLLTEHGVSLARPSGRLEVGGQTIPQPRREETELAQRRGRGRRMELVDTISARGFTDRPFETRQAQLQDAKARGSRDVSRQAAREYLERTGLASFPKPSPKLQAVLERVKETVGGSSAGLRGDGDREADLTREQRIALQNAREVVQVELLEKAVATSGFDRIPQNGQKKLVRAVKREAVTLVNARARGLLRRRKPLTVQALTTSGGSE